METWWNSLPLSLAIFYGIAFVGTIALALELLLKAFGLHDMSVGDLSAGEHPGGLSMLSFSSLVSFCLGLGWGGVLTIRLGGEPLTAALIGGALGVSLVLGQYTLMRVLVSLRASGTLDYANAIGQVGRAYTPIPPHRAPGGQIEVLCQGRLITATALQDGNTVLATGTTVQVTATLGTTLIVTAA